MNGILQNRARRCSFRTVTVMVLLLFAGLFPGRPLVGQALADSLSEARAAHFRKLGITAMAHIAPPVDFNLEDTAGRRVHLSDLKGKVVFINFWTTWCGACRIEMPAMQGLHEHLKDRDFVMLAVDLRESSGQVKRFLDAYKLTFTVLLDKDGDVARSFGIRSIPTTFIFDKEGGMIGRAMGPRDWNSGDSRDLFEHLLADEPAGRPTPRQVGKGH